PRPGSDIGAERDRLHALHPVGGDDQARRQARHSDSASLLSLAHAAFLLATARTAASTAARSLGTTVKCSGRSYRSARRGGRGGRMPIACSIASGNFAGWAVAAATIGTPCPAGSA